VSHTRAADGRAGRRPDRDRTDRTRAAAGTRTPRPGDTLARPAWGRGAPGLTGRPVPGRGDHGGRTRRPDARRYPPTAHALLGGDAVSICQGATAAARQHAQARHDACASCPRRRGVGLPVSGHRQAAPAPAPGKAPRSAAGHPLEGTRPARHTVAPAPGQRQTGPAGRRRHGAGRACLAVGHGQARGQATAGLTMPAGASTGSPRLHRLSAETQPRCGVTLGGVRRPTGTRVPRMRQAPDGGTSGGTQPTESSVSNRRVFLAPALPRAKRNTRGCGRKKVAPNP